MGDVAHDGFAAIANGHMLHRDLLLAAGSVALERFHLRSERSRELGERTLRTEAVSPILQSGRRVRSDRPRHRRSLRGKDRYQGRDRYQKTARLGHAEAAAIAHRPHGALGH
jgi:hypothetical protein